MRESRLFSNVIKNVLGFGEIVGFHVEEDGGYCLNCEGYGSPTFTYSVNWMEMKWVSFTFSLS